MKILTVCTGNICRSPTAEGVLRHLAPKDWRIDSCGTSDYHIGDAPDERAIAIAAERQIDIADLRARQVSPQDFYDFDYLLAMDVGHLAQLQAICPDDGASNSTSNSIGDIALYMDKFAANQDVPDPYYGSPDDFRKVLAMVFDGAEAWLKALK